MAIGDILEGLLGGAAGGLRRYSAYQEEEAARREREAEREAARLEREEERDYQRELDRALRDFTMAEAGYRVAPEMAVEGATIAPTAPELARVLEEPEFGVDIPAPRRPETRDGRMDGGAMVAPGQTYSAIQQALMEAERPEAAPPRSRVVMERGEAPEPIRLPSAAERGASVLRFPDDRTYVRERQLTEAEKRAGIEELFVRGLTGDQAALSEISTRDLGADFRTFVKMVQPDVEAPDLKSTSEGLLRWDPETGRYVPEIGPSGRPLMAPQPSPPSPARPLSIQGEDGIEYLVDPITGEGRPVTIGGQPLVGRRSSNFFSPFFPSGSGGEQMNGFNMPPIDSLESSYQQYRQQSPQQTGGSDGLTEEEASVENAVAEIRRNPNRAEAVIERFKNAPNLRDAIRRRVFGPSVTTQSVPVRG
jgi:hypothetical protein